MGFPPLGPQWLCLYCSQYKYSVLQSQGAHVLFDHIKDMLIDSTRQCQYRLCHQICVVEAARQRHEPRDLRADESLQRLHHRRRIRGVPQTLKAKSIATMVKRQVLHAIFMHVLRDLNAAEYKKATCAKAAGKAYTATYVHTLKFAGTTRKISNVSTLGRAVIQPWFCVAVAHVRRHW
eukprot:529074-Rhodomonas_salina.1